MSVQEHNASFCVVCIPNYEVKWAAGTAINVNANMIRCSKKRRVASLVYHMAQTEKLNKK